jgi:hypothetical protein
MSRADLRGDFSPIREDMTPHTLEVCKEELTMNGEKSTEKACGALVGARPG